MSWRDNLSDASFRGIPFYVSSARGQVGRRVVLHEFPGRDQPSTEDLGLLTRKISIEAFVIGENYMADRDELRVAVETAGLAFLVHPYWGSLDVVVTSPVSISETTREGGMARLTFEAVEAGDELPVVTRINTVADVAAAADKVDLALLEAFEEAFAILELAGDIVDGVIAVVQGVARDLRKIKGKIDAALGVIDDIKGAIDELSSTISDIITLPGTIAQKFIGAVASIKGSINNIRSAISSTFGGPYDALRDATGKIIDMATATADEIEAAIAARDLTAVTDDFKVDTLMEAFRSTAVLGEAEVTAPGTTPQRQLERQCQQAFADLMYSAATVEAIRVAATLDMSSCDKATAVMSELLEHLDAIADVAEDDAVYYALVELRSAFVRHIQETAVNLPRVIEHIPAMTLPSLVIAHDLYGDAAREGDIIARNGISNPAFVQGGQALEVLSHV